MSALTLTKSTVSTLTATAPLGSWVAALKVAGVGIGARPPVPVLTGVKIGVTDGRVMVHGFDYETLATAVVYGGAGTDGEVLVAHKLLLDMLVTAGKRATKKVSDGWPVSIGHGENNSVIVMVNGTKFSLAQLPMDAYPTLPDLGTVNTVKVDAGEFIRRMDSAMVAASKDDTLPILTGLKIEVSHGTMTVLATDRYRLVMAELAVEGAGEYSGLLRGKTWKALKRVLSAKGGMVTIGFHGDRWITFAQDELEVCSLMVDGDYPRIRSLFPDYAEIVFEVDADMLASMVATVSVTAERNTPVRLTYNGIDSLRIDAGTGEDAQAEAFMPYSSPRGNRGFAVAFNPAYLLAVMKDLKGQTVEIQHTSAPKPACIVGKATDAVKHLIMPVRLPNA